MAEYYSCTDSDTLVHGDEAEAVADWLDGWMSPGCDVLAVIRARSPIEVIAYEREVMPDNFASNVAARLVESAIEDWGEDFGPADDAPDVDDAAIKAAEEAVTAALRALYATMTVWRCAQVSKHLLSAEEVEAMMRAHSPEWFEDEKVHP